MTVLWQLLFAAPIADRVRRNAKQFRRILDLQILVDARHFDLLTQAAPNGAELQTLPNLNGDCELDGPLNGVSGDTLTQLTGRLNTETAQLRRQLLLNEAISLYCDAEGDSTL